MPDINYQMPGFEGLNEEQMKQSSENACGAYALVGAVGAFGVFEKIPSGGIEITYKDKGPEAVDKSEEIEKKNKYKYPDLAKSVYKVTGILNVPPPIPVNPELKKEGEWYNSPAAMASVAITLGQKTIPLKVIVNAGKDAELLKIYPNAEGRCREAVKDHGEVNLSAEYKPPGANQTQTIVVFVGAAKEGLHWLARGSNGDWYDPGYGTVENKWTINDNGQIMDGDKPTPYTFAQVWLTVEKP